MSVKSYFWRLILLGCFSLSVSVWADDGAEAPAATDEIVLQNGSRLIGEVTELRENSVHIKTKFAGDLAIAMEHVVSVTTRDAVVMQLADDTVVQGSPLLIEQDQLVIAAQDGPRQSRPLEELLVVNPEPWELGEGYKWSGDVSFAFSIERGNSVTDELDYNLNTVWQSDDDRYTFKLRGELDEANGTRNADNWKAIGKWDYFFDRPEGDRDLFDGPNYWGWHIYAEEDPFADLNLRFFTGPYMGRDFFTAPVFSVAGEIGLAYVSEDFITAENQEYPGATWNMHMSSNYLGGDSSLYLDQLGVWNLSETADVVVNTTFGLSFPLLFGLEAAAEVLLEYDSGAVAGVEKLDETYALRIGYTW